MSAPISINTQLLNLTNSGNLQLINTNNTGRFTMSVKGFTIYSSDFTSQYNGYGNEGDNTGFSIGGSYESGRAYYGPIFSQDAGGNAAKGLEILAYWNNNGLTINNYSYLFNITYGPGSTVSSGIVVASFYYSGINTTNINIGTVDTSVPGWDTPGTDPFSLTALNGTFYLPFTLNVYKPITQDVNDWC